MLIHKGGVTMAKRITCPAWTCGSTEVAPVNTKKKFSVGKAIVGNTIGFAVGGPVGGIVGAATGFNGKKKTTFVCMKCGRTFEVKI